ncbi:patched family protein [Dictyocaulus viviparus]|uniref:Patched family protein n=1 Tax=Dictyocaulus viviparus TaxID=29172 RepID=A0A0D8YFZ5_DICVI|nr:patched family protein [Dictyocaulus viviparus]
MGINSASYEKYMKYNNPRETFTDSESASHKERLVLEEFLQQNGTLNMIEVIIQSRDNGSLLRDEYRLQMRNLLNEIANDIIVKITYPTMNVLGKKIFIASSIYGISFYRNTTIIEGFRSVVLRYYMVYSETKPLLEWENKLVNLLYDSGKYNLLDCGAASDNLVSQEVKSMGTKSAPLLGVALIVLIIFLVVCSFRFNRRESKPLESLAGGFTPLLAGVTTVGLVSATGLAFQSIVVSTLFLVLAIGIDDVFIMLSAWHRTEKNMDIPKRVAEMVQASGCSITVTSITNLISFGNGVLSTTPVLQTFAIYSAVASIVCYFYQIIFFPAILALTAHNEYKKVDDDDCITCFPEELTIIKHAGVFHDRFWKSLARTVVKPWMFLITIMVLTVYWSITYYGISIVDTDLSVQKFARSDARIAQFKIRYDATIKDMQTVAIVVTSPGDLRDPQQLNSLMNMIKDYETATYSYGSESTSCFLESYLEFLTFHEGDDEDQAVAFTYVHIPAFLESDNYWAASMRIDKIACKLNQPSCLQSFLFTTGFTTVVRYNEMFPIIQEWRAISQKYPRLGVYAYTERSAYADQTDVLVYVIWQTLYSEVLCMGISFVIFIPDVVSIIAAMFSLLSVNLGVFGFLSLSGVGIDPISMAALLMSIGFSVDISAHISYHYYRVESPDPLEKIEDAFLNIGWATMQGSLSALFAMIPIAFKPCYLFLVFLKTVTLVSIFGLLHGLIVLPVFLSTFTAIRNKLFKCTVKSTDCNKSNKSGSIYPIQPHRISIKSLGTYKGHD